jgi:Pyridoxamine 5'-phosphate oxidase
LKALERGPCMAKHVGVKLPDDILAVLKKEMTVAVLATFSEKGLPHTTPIQSIYPKGLESLLISIHKDHTGYHNMVWQKKVMLCFLDEGNVAYSILGRAGVVRAPSLVHPFMNIVRIDIIDIKSDRSMLTRVDAGVRWSHTSPDAEELSKALMNELKELARTL